MGILKPFEDIRKGSIFLIPNYQRSYAWEDKQIEDLIDDVKATLNEEVKHYLGQITLKKRNNIKNYTIYEVIDGQQRITSLMLLFLAFEEVYGEVRDYLIIKDNDVIAKLEKDYNINSLVEELPLLIPSEINRDTFFKIFNENNIEEKEEELNTNCYLIEAYRRFKSFISKFNNIRDNSYWDLVQNLLLMVKFDITEENLIESEYTATKIFLSLNDRGKPLSILERLKGLLMYYDMKDLNGELQDNNVINNNFAEIYKNYDYIISKENIASNLRFKETTLFNYFYHYIWKYLNKKFSLEISYDYDKNAEDIYSDIRRAIKELNGNDLKKFIEKFVVEFRLFSDAFREVIYQEENEKLYMIVHMLPLSARPYPLLIGLWLQNKLEDEILTLIEKIDMFIYKARGTDPRAKLYKKVISELIYLEEEPIKIEKVKEELNNFLNIFKTSCEERHTQLTKYIFWQYGKQKIGDDYDLLNTTLYDDLENEHILVADEENYEDYGFESYEEYRELKDTIGNLTILQSKPNKLASNKGPAEKANIYMGYNINDNDIKILNINYELGSKIKDTYNGSYKKQHIIERTKEILNFVKETWSIEF